MKRFATVRALVFAVGLAAFPSTSLFGQTTVVGWGGNGFGEINAPTLPAGQQFDSLFGGIDVTSGLTNVGTFHVWGDSTYGPSNVPALPSGVTYTKAAYGAGWTTALRSDGQVVAWGANTYGGLNVPALPPGTTYVDVESAMQNSAAVRSDGVVATWGNNSWNQLAVPTPPAGVSYVEVEIGLWFMLGRRSDGQIVGWGRNTYGQLNVPALPSGTTYARVWAGASFGIALRSDGQLVGWGQNHAGQLDVPALGAGQSYVDASTYAHHVVALRSDGAVLCFGENGFGQLDVPAFPAGLRVIDVEAGAWHTLARLEPIPPSGPCVVGVNAALAFDGADDFVRIGTPPALDLAGAITLEAWVRPTNASGTQDIVSRGLHSANPAFFQGVGLSIQPLGPPGAETPHYAAYSVLSAGFSQGVFAPVLPADIGTWVHLAGAYDGAAWRLYKNGVLVATAPSFIGAIPTPSEWTIGAHDGVDRFFQGSIDEVRVWSFARSADEIATHNGLGLIGDEAGLVGYWRCDGAPTSQSVPNAATASGPALDGICGGTVVAGTDDPSWITTDLPPVPYCPPCTTPPCGQVNSPCATLVVNGVGAGAQGPIDVTAAPGSVLSFAWTGPPGQPYVLVATTQFFPGQWVFDPSFVIDVDTASYVVLFSGFDPLWGPLFFTDATGFGAQAWLLPPTSLGFTLRVQGLMYDTGLTCGSLPYMTTAAFAIHL